MALTSDEYLEATEAEIAAMKAEYGEGAQWCKMWVSETIAKIREAQAKVYAAKETNPAP